MLNRIMKQANKLSYQGLNLPRPINACLLILLNSTGAVIWSKSKSEYLARFTFVILDGMHVEYPSVKTTTHSEDLISDKCIDAIAVGTPVAAHFELGMAALKAGTLCGSKNQ
jgi:hypothetical protein